jgi:AcrR family transcriptional regulator
VRGCSQIVYENVLIKVNSEYEQGEGATSRPRTCAGGVVAGSGKRGIRRKRVRSNNDDSDRRARGASIGSLYQFFPTKEQVAATLIEQYVTELEAAFDRLSEEVPLLNVSVVAGRLTTLFVAFRTTYPAFVGLVDARDVVLPGGTGVRERLRKGIASVLAALAPRLSVKEALFRAVIVQHLMKAAVTLTHDASVVDHHAAILEFQHVVEHYLEDVMEAARGGRTGAAQRGTAPHRVLDVRRLPLEPGEPARIAGWSFRLVNVADP